MKKITKSDLDGLKLTFPVYGEEAMRKVLGGSSEIDIITEYLMQNLGPGLSFTDNRGNFFWFDSYVPFYDAYTSYLQLGYVDNLWCPGYFYLDNGEGFTCYFNSIYGYGPNEIAPTQGLCFFEAIAAIKEVNVQDVFTQYKNAGYGYSIDGPYIHHVDQFLSSKGWGYVKSADSISSQIYNTNITVIGMHIERDSGPTDKSTHAYEIISQSGNNFTARDIKANTFHSFNKNEMLSTFYCIYN
jgi:hypothetical protein